MTHQELIVNLKALIADIERMSEEKSETQFLDSSSYDLWANTAAGIMNHAAMEDHCSSVDYDYYAATKCQSSLFRIQNEFDVLNDLMDLSC